MEILTPATSLTHLGQARHLPTPSLHTPTLCTALFHESGTIHFGSNSNAITFFGSYLLHSPELDWSIPYSLCRIWMEQNVCGLLIWRTPYSEPAQKPPSCPVSSPLPSLPLQIARYSSDVSRIIGNEYPVLGPLGSPLTAVVASSDSILTEVTVLVTEETALVASSDSSDSIDSIGDSIECWRHVTILSPGCHYDEGHHPITRRLLVGNK